MNQATAFVLGGLKDQSISVRAPALFPESMIYFADFEKIHLGDEAHCDKTISAEDVENFAQLSGDTNPLHMDENFALRTDFQRRVVHGMLLASYVSALVGVHCPGPGGLWSQQNFRWPAPVFIGDRIHIKLRVTHKSTGARALTIQVQGMNQNGKVVMEGEGVVSVLEEHQRTKDVSITERVAYVTGASSEIGAAIASTLAQAGAAIVINYRNEASAAEELCAKIESGGGRAISVRADLTDYASVNAGMRRARDQFKRPVDLLVNNCDVFPEVHAFVQTTWDEIQSVVDIHLRSAFNCCQAVIPGMCEQKSGRIINIGSAFVNSTPPANWSSYLIAKSALKGLTRSLAVELGPQGIRVNMVSPGLVENENIPGLPDRIRKVHAMQTPLRRLASAADIAGVVSALCSDAGEFITGTDIPVCGGFQV